MSNDSTKKTLMVALGVCLVCSILVSTAAVALKGIQKENQKQEKLKNILEAAGLMERGIDLDGVYQERIQPVLVELAFGRIIQGGAAEDLSPERFDLKAVAKNEAYSRLIPTEKDMAQIKRMPTHMVVYFVKEGMDTVKTILPIYGKGLWSTMYGFIALGNDLITIEGFTFYEHGETPGLGGEIDNPRWKRLWVGKQAFDVEGNLRINVIKGQVDGSSPDAKYQVDGLSGSTLTTRGVDQTVRFWLGGEGYGPFLERMKEEG